MFPGPSCPATGFFVCASPAPSSWGLSFSCPFFPVLIFRLSGMACRTAAGPCSPVCGGLLSFVPPFVPDAESLCFPYILHSYQSFLFHGPGREVPAAAQRRGPAIPTGAKFFRGWRGYGGGRGRFYKKRPFLPRHRRHPHPRPGWTGRDNLRMLPSLRALTVASGRYHAGFPNRGQNGDVSGAAGCRGGLPS